MPIIIKAARSTEEIQDVLELRFQTALQARRILNRMFQASKKIIDPFDVYPGTLNSIAYEGGKPIGTLRAVEFNPANELMYEIFDYRESAKNLRGSSYLLDMICIDRNFSAEELVKKYLLKTILSLLHQKNVRNVFFNIPAAFEKIATSLGFSPISRKSLSSTLDLEITPAILDLDKYFDLTMNEVVDKEIIRFQEIFYAVLFLPGEILVVEGEHGNTAYVIEEGEVEVVLSRNDQVIPISKITKGHLIGEVAMITDEPRTASLLAMSPTACIAFDREDFMRLMYAEPHRSLDVFKIFSKRLSESNQRLAEARQQSTSSGE